MAKLFGTAFDIRPDEKRLTWLMVFYHYLLLVVLYFLKPARDSLFLVKLGADQLPFVFILIAFVGIPITALYARSGRRLELNHLINGTTAVLVIGLLLLRVLLRLEQGWVFYLFYVYVSVYGILVVSQFWLFANAIFSVAQAKRVFTLLGLGGIAGAITGGGIASVLVDQIGISTTDLVLICAAILLATTILVNCIWKRRSHDAIRSKCEDRDGRGDEHRYGIILSTLLHSRYLLLIVGITALATVASTLIDFQFKTFASEAFADEENLTAFLARFYGLLSVASVLLQLLFTQRLLKILGVSGVVALLPIGLLIGSVGILLVPCLTVLTLVRGLEGSLSYSADKTGRELLYLPVPLKIKKRTKVFIDMFADRFFQGVAGGLLLLFTLVWHFSVLSISVVVLVVAAVWLLLVSEARRGYVSSFRKALRTREIDPESLQVDISEATTINTLIATLASDNDREVIYALDLLATVRSAKTIEPAYSCLGHANAEIRYKAMRVLNLNANPGRIEKIEKLTTDSDARVRREAVCFLAGRAGEGRVGFLEKALRSDDLLLETAAADCIAEYGSENERGLIDRHIIVTLMKEKGPYRVLCREIAARLIGRIQNPEWYGFLGQMFGDRSSAVVKTAMSSAGWTAQPAFVSFIIGKLGDGRYRAEAVSALAEYGPSVLALLRNTILDRRVNLTIRRAVPRVISRISDQRAVDVLCAIYDKVEPFLKFPLVRAMNKLRQRFAELSFDAGAVGVLYANELVLYYQMRLLLNYVREDMHTPAQRLLARALEENLASNLERVFRLLGLVYPQDDIYTAYISIAGEKPANRAEALEFLNGMLTVDDRRLLLPLLEDRLPQSVGEVGAFADFECHSRTDALKYLLDNSDVWLRACVFYTACSETDESLWDKIRSAERDHDTVVAEARHLALSLHHAEEQRVETSPGAEGRHRAVLNFDPGDHKRMLTIVEKVIFLQGVDVFENVPTSELAHLAAIAGEVSFLKGEEIYHRNDPSDALYVVLEGTVRLHEEQQTIATAGPKSAFGTWALFDDEPRVVTAVAAENCRLLRVDREDFIDLLADHVQITRGVLKKMAARLRGLVARVAPGTPGG